MSFLALPGNKGGVYRVKVDKNQYNLYLKYNPVNKLVHLATLDESDKSAGILFKWYIGPTADSTAFTIRPAYDTDYGLYRVENKPQGKQVPNGEPPAGWLITKLDGQYYSTIAYKSSDLKVLSSSTKLVEFSDRVNDGTRNQNFVFQFVESTFEQLWFQLTPQRAAKEQYDVIVIGTGMGGGVIAGDLFDKNTKLGEKAKSVLVIEKGGLPFHSHCLNASRPTGFNEDRGQQNDTFFSLFKENYQFEKEVDRKQWKGGPMFNLGGRSAAWGLFVPRIHDEYLRKWFGDDLTKDLVRNWYKEAEDLMDVFLPTTHPLHRNLMERMNIDTLANKCQWRWARIASQFSQPKNFDFATGAYSPIDKLLEIAMSKVRNPDGACEEHKNWRILLNTEVRSIQWNEESPPRATGVIVRDASGTETAISLKKKTLSDTCIVLGAGSVGSPAILMRSTMEQDIKDKGLTDHDLFAATYTFRYRDPSIRDKVGPMKLQSYVHLTDTEKTIALVNVAIDSFSFLPREFLPQQYFTNRDFPKLIFAYILPTKLNDNNSIQLVDGEPVVVGGRAKEFSNQDPIVQELRTLTKTLVNTIKEALDIEQRSAPVNDDNFFRALELGGVAHELGTLPLQGRNPDNSNTYIVNNDLKLRGRNGVYVCDLSIFPFSPEVNPTLTLVALALRLSKRIGSLAIATAVDSITVVNHSGDRIKVQVSNLQGSELKKVIDNKEKYEAVLVRTLEFNEKNVFVPQPVSYVAKIGEVIPIE